jgi:hypothetical protein
MATGLGSSCTCSERDQSCAEVQLRVADPDRTNVRLSLLRSSVPGSRGKKGTCASLRFAQVWTGSLIKSGQGR